MPFTHIPPSWQLPDSAATPETAFWNRRRFIKTLVGAGIGASALGLNACGQARNGDIDPALRQTLGRPLNSVRPNPDFRDGGRPITEQVHASRYNNFYEFGGTKNIWQNAQKLPTDPWTLEVGGLVNNPRTYDLADLTRRFPLEERVYRFRCVEAWAMVVPWIGFPMRALLEDVEPTSDAKFVSFTSFYDPKVTPGPAWEFALNLPWPYVEGLRIEEMANELAFFAVGLYGRTLPKQHGAPIRMVLPWKYGFKGGKSIVKIEFLREQPATYWNMISPNEYKFEANVEPEVPHPRWSQSRERIVGSGTNPFNWEVQPTVIYNGYGEYVADLYGV
ncbi:protein-methionine-sulfoxide reductase catalytic subunit MsrP [Leptolyngbya sp. PCC 6406]|uniref:protein-methionine-sulfoxide reductase catalytic subunit MsrP n=1 Tax=Leptolyngbya sp. PCC 6406 TaxID=1173264 RepID=UPI0002ACF1B5|nr:protein-methionine-sulfoxide reductase catalytic subunit MsrP [Leptolyngbya sp. PCC 6406]